MYSMEQVTTGAEELERQFLEIERKDAREIGDVECEAREVEYEVRTWGFWIEESTGLTSVWGASEKIGDRVEYHCYLVSQRQHKPIFRFACKRVPVGDNHESTSRIID